jgi:exonuclease SbcD
MKTIAIIADSHFSERSRWDECIRIHDWIADDMEARGVDLVLHAGDVFDAKSTPTERLAVATWLQRVATYAPIVIVRGNHDSLGDLELMGRISSKHLIVVEEAVGVHHVAGVSVACLAWPRKAELMARMVAAGHEQTEQGVSANLKAILLGFRAELERCAHTRVLLTHAMVRGSTTSTGQLLVGCDAEIGTDDLECAGADFVALGHIHQHQEFESTEGVPIVYPGSPRRTSFGEVEKKGYVVVVVDNVGVRWEFIESPATQMILLEAEWDDEARTLVGMHLPTDVVGAELRLRYMVPAHKRDAAKRIAEEFKTEAIARGAKLVKLEEVVDPVVRARAPEVAEAKTPADKLVAYWKARGEMPLAREKMLLAKVDLLEAMEVL